MATPQPPLRCRFYTLSIRFDHKGTPFFHQLVQYSTVGGRTVYSLQKSRRTFDSLDVSTQAPVPPIQAATCPHVFHVPCFWQRRTRISIRPRTLKRTLCECCCVVPSLRRFFVSCLVGCLCTACLNAYGTWPWVVQRMSQCTWHLAMGCATLVSMHRALGHGLCNACLNAHDTWPWVVQRMSQCKSVASIPILVRI